MLFVPRRKSYTSFIKSFVLYNQTPFSVSLSFTFPAPRSFSQTYVVVVAREVKSNFAVSSMRAYFTSSRFFSLSLSLFTADETSKRKRRVLVASWTEIVSEILPSEELRRCRVSRTDRQYSNNRNVLYVIKRKEEKKKKRKKVKGHYRLLMVFAGVWRKRLFFRWN